MCALNNRERFSDATPHLTELPGFQWLIVRNIIVLAFIRYVFRQFPAVRVFDWLVIVRVFKTRIGHFRWIFCWQVWGSGHSFLLASSDADRESTRLNSSHL